MENNIQIDTQYDDEIDLRKLFGVLWTEKLKIIAITSVFSFFSVIYALSLPNQYTATTQLVSAQSGSSDLSGALGQLGGLAKMAGVSIGGGQSNESQIAQEIMKSWSFVESFIAENNIALEVYAAEGWNEGSNELQINEEVYDTKNKQWLFENESGVTGPPSSWELFEAFSERLEVSEDNKSGFVYVSIKYYSPQIAKQWLDMYVAAINSYMQERQVKRVTNNINYLQAQIEQTSMAEMREVFYKIIEEQTKNKMLAEASPEFAFVAVSPSMVPAKKSEPMRALICIFGALLGGMLSVLLVLVMHFTLKPN